MRWTTCFLLKRGGLSVWRPYPYRVVHRMKDGSVFIATTPVLKSVWQPFSPGVWYSHLQHIQFLKHFIMCVIILIWLSFLFLIWSDSSDFSLRHEKEKNPCGSVFGRISAVFVSDGLSISVQILQWPYLRKCLQWARTYNRYLAGNGVCPERLPGVQPVSEKASDDQSERAEESAVLHEEREALTPAA